MIQNRATRPFAATLIALVAFAVITSPLLTAYAAAPVNAISYQGRLLDTSGNPVSDASAEFVFRLYGSAAGVDCLWQSDDGAACAGADTQTVALNDGLFSENIGSSVDPAGLSEAYPVDLSGVFENNADVYLEVVINGETLSPRKQIVAAPFALNSQSLDGLDSTDFLSNAGDTATGAFEFTGNMTMNDADADSILIGAAADTVTIASNALSLADDDWNVSIAGAASFASVTLSGLVSTMVMADAAGTIVAATAGTDYMDGALADNSVFIGNGAGAATAVSLSGDVTSTNLGVLTIGSGKVDGDKILDDSIGWADIADATTLDADTSIATDGFALSTTGTGALTFSSTGQVSFSGNVNATNGLDVTVASLTVGGANFSVDPATGDTIVGGDLGVTGTSTLAATTATTLGATGNVTMNDAGADTIAIGAAADTVTIASNVLSLADDNWNVSSAGAANFASIGAVASGTGKFSTLTLDGLASAMLKTDGAGTLVAASAGTDYLTGALADNKILIGNGAGAATAVSLSGDVTSTNLGVLTIGSGTVDGDKILNDAVDWADIADATTLDADTSIATAGFALSTTGLGALTFSSTGQVSFAGNVNATSGLDVTGASLTVGGANFSVDNASGDTIVGGTLGATGDVTMNDAGADTIAIGAASDTVTIASNVLSLADDNWNVSSAGAANFASIGAVAAGTGAFSSLSASSLSLSGNIDMSNNLIVNIGHAGTDFTAGGGLTLAGDVAVDGGDITSTGMLTIDSSGTVQLGADDNFVTTGNISSTLTAAEAIVITSVSPDPDVSSAAVIINFGAFHDDSAINTNYALHIIQTEVAGAPEYGADALIFLESDGGADSAESGLRIGGGVGIGLDTSQMGSGYDIRLNNMETIDNLTDDLVSLTGSGGADNTDIRFDLDGTMPVIDSPTDGDISIGTAVDNLLVGATSKAGVKATFDLSGGDIYANGDIAAQFNMYADSFTAGDASTTFADGSITTTGATDLSLVIAGGDLTFGQNTIIGDGVDVLSVNSSDWDIGTTGNMSGIGTIGADGDFTTSADVIVNGGDLIVAGAAFNLANAATTLNLGSTDIARTVNIGSGTGIDTINIGTGIGLDVISIGDSAGTLKLTSNAGAIDFAEFDVANNTGSVTIDDNGNLGKLLVEGTGLDINSLDFVGIGAITTAGAQTLTFDSSSGTIEGAVNDQFVVKAPSSSGPAGFEDSPSLTVRGTYFNGTTQNFNTTINTNMLSAGASPTATLDFNLNGTGVEMSVNEVGTLTAIGGASFGDGTNVDKFDFTSIATVTDILTVTASSAVSQSAGSAMLIQRANSGATNFTSTAGLLNVSMLDTDSASTGPVSKFINKGTGSSVFIDADGNTGGTVSDAVGGALHITNSGNTGYGLSVYSNQNGSSTSGALSKFHAANTGWDGYVMEIESGATDAGSANGSALHIIQNEVDAAVGNLLGTQALAIDINQNCGAGDGTQDDGAVIKVRKDALGTPDTIFRLECDGDLFLDGTVGVAAVDVAENFSSADALTPGELVSVDPSTVGVVRTSGSYDSHLIGAVSTLPGLLLGSELPGYRIALAGRIPLNVTSEGGAIAAGDAITSSSTPGYGMKSTQAGAIVGFALEAYSGSGPGSIIAFVSPQFYVGSVLASDGSATTVSGNFAMGSTGIASATTTGFNSSAFALRGSGWDGALAQSVQMSMTTDVTNASDYRLSIKNTAGSEVAYVSQAGDMALSGRLYPSDRGTLQTSKYIYYDGSSGSGGDFMRTNASGWATGSYDFAEMFPSVDMLEAGDVVMFGTTNESVMKSTGSSASLAGIVSTRPGFLAGENTAGHFPIALAGRVPTKVSLQNGSIAIGDPLTASATKGYAMKATESGPIVGYALEAYSGAAGADDKVIAFVNAGYWAGGPVSPTPGTSNSASTIIVRQDADNLTTLNMEGNIYMAGNDILGVGRIAGLSDRWSLEEDGTIKTAAAFKTVIESYQGEMVETTAVTSPDVQITLVGSATLENGEAVIRFEDASPSFNDVTSTTAPIRVIVTPNGPVSLYVYEKNNDGFGVRQMNGADSGITFDWMVSAYRKDYESAETATVEEPVVVDEPIVEETEQAPIADPVEEEIVVSDPAVEVTEPIVDETVPVSDSTESNSVEPEPNP